VPVPTSRRRCRIEPPDAGFERDIAAALTLVNEDGLHGTIAVYLKYEAHDYDQGVDGDA
jgi:hypothetical protein